METLTTGTAERQRHYVQRQQALGRVKATWWLDQDLVEAVHRLADQFDGDKATRINAVLRRALLEK